MQQCRHRHYIATCRRKMPPSPASPYVWPKSFQLAHLGCLDLMIYTSRNYSGSNIWFHIPKVNWRRSPDHFLRGLWLAHHVGNGGCFCLTVLNPLKKFLCIIIFLIQAPNMITSLLNPESHNDSASTSLITLSESTNSRTATRKHSSGKRRAEMLLIGQLPQYLSSSVLIPTCE